MASLIVSKKIEMFYHVWVLDLEMFYQVWVLDLEMLY
jgi:hypothetical protein